MNPPVSSAATAGLSLEDLGIDLQALSSMGADFDLSAHTSNGGAFHLSADGSTAHHHLNLPANTFFHPAHHQQQPPVSAAPPTRKYSPQTTSLLEQLQVTLQRAQSAGNYELIRQLQVLIQFQGGLPQTPLSMALHPSSASSHHPTSSPLFGNSLGHNQPTLLHTPIPNTDQSLQSPAVSPTLLPEAAMGMPPPAARKRQHPDQSSAGGPPATAFPHAATIMSPLKRPNQARPPVSDQAPRKPARSRTTSSRQATPRVRPTVESSPMHRPPESPAMLAEAQENYVNAALLNSPFFFGAAAWSPWMHPDAQALANLSLASPGMLQSPAFSLSAHTSPLFIPHGGGPHQGPAVSAPFPPLNGTTVPAQMDFTLGSPGLSAAPNPLGPAAIASTSTAPPVAMLASLRSLESHSRLTAASSILPTASSTPNSLNRFQAPPSENTSSSRSNTNTNSSSRSRPTPPRLDQQQMSLAPATPASLMQLNIQSADMAQESGAATMTAEPSLDSLAMPPPVCPMQSPTSLVHESATTPPEKLAEEPAASQCKPRGRPKRPKSAKGTPVMSGSAPQSHPTRTSLGSAPAGPVPSGTVPPSFVAPIPPSSPAKSIALTSPGMGPTAPPSLIEASPSISATDTSRSHRIVDRPTLTPKGVTRAS
ncbi:hypothetical protein BJ085DRAFT_38381, partial [Dimargaris cristalligena]